MRKGLEIFQRIDMHKLDRGTRNEKRRRLVRTLMMAMLAMSPLTSVPHCVNAQDIVRAEDILGNPDYPAIAFGGYRQTSRDVVPTVDQLKEDLRILSAMGVRVLRTYNTQQYAHAANLLEAIRQLRKEQPGFHMYVMLGAWIECEGAWTNNVNHESENVENNTAEIEAAVALARKYRESVKIIAVGNEAMVHWATSYFVRPGVILKWVNHLQTLKASGQLPADLWVTSSDNFASWGGGDPSYHTDDLTALIKAVDFVSLHTYPFHDSHYNSAYWVAPADEADMNALDRAKSAILRARDYAKDQYQTTENYIKSLGINKPIHIGETGWASQSNSLYGPQGSQAADEFKAKLYYDATREWTNNSGISCFYFEAFDEPWKDAGNPGGSENHFGLINIQGQAKYALWDMVDAGTFEGLTRGGSTITKTFDGDEHALLASTLQVPSTIDLGLLIATVNDQRSLGDEVNENKYVISHKTLVPNGSNGMTYPSDVVKLNVWEGTCSMKLSGNDAIRVTPGEGAWWGCGLEIQGKGKGENLSRFGSGNLHFEIKGETKSPFDIGFQTGVYAHKTQTNNFVTFKSGGKYQLSGEWTTHSIPMAELNRGAKLSDVTSLLYLKGEKRADSKSIEIRNVYYSRK